MIILKKHQKKFVEKNPVKCIMAWSTRAGKTYAIAFWALNRPKTRFILVCPKRIVDQWRRDLEACRVSNVIVASKEKFKFINLESYNGLIIDEAHHFASPIFDHPSQMTVKAYEFVRANPDMPVLLATATPIASKPANLHTLATLTGRHYDWPKYREYFYRLVRRPYAPHPFWEPKSEWRKLIQPFARKLCDIVLLSDIVDVPEQKHDIIPVVLTDKTQKAIKDFSDISPSKEWYGKHQLSQGQEKIDVIRELSEDESKVIVVAKYKKQIADLKKELEKDREVFVLDGDTKRPLDVIDAAHNATECYFILQADCAEGFRGDSFSMMIFASMSWKYVSYQQALGRMLHLEKKLENQFYYLLACDKDKDVYERIKAGEDFSIASIKEAEEEEGG
jgi:hypothetical protein